MERVDSLRTGGPVGAINADTPGAAGADAVPDQVPARSPSTFVCVTDDKSRVLYANHTALAAFGCSSGAAIGTSICRYVQARDLERVLVRQGLAVPRSCRGRGAAFRIGGTRDADVRDRDIDPTPCIRWDLHPHAGDVAGRSSGGLPCECR